MGRRKKGEDDATVRDRLLERVGESFFSRSKLGFSMDDIAKSTRVSKKTLYRFFPNKEEMILTVARRFLSRITSIVEHKLGEIDKKGPDAFIPAIMDILGRLGSVILSMSPALLREMEASAPMTMEKIFALREDVIVRLFSKILAKGQKLGKIRRDIDTEIASRVYAGMVNMITSRLGTSPFHAPFDVYLTIVKIVFHGVMNPDVEMKIDAKTLSLEPASNPWELIKLSRP
jgi:AcrR family transcriptional regulator